MSVCVTTTRLLTIGLPAQVIVEQTRSDLIRVLPRKNPNGKTIKEQIVRASFKEMLRKGIIVAASEVPVNLKPFYPEPPKVEA